MQHAVGKCIASASYSPTAVTVKLGCQRPLGGPGQSG